jgi:signal transduction histidine kinase
MAEPEAHATARAHALLGAGLALVEEGATGRELAARFAEAGAVVPRDRAAALLERLAALGLVAVAAAGLEPRYVPTTLGRQQRAGLLEGAPDVADRLAELEQLRGDLVAAVAHELRTPLTAVRTSIGLLLDPDVEPDAAARARLLRNIAHGADRMQQLVTDVLDLARFRTGRVRLQSRRFDARGVAEDAAAAMGPLFGSRRQRLEVRLPRRPVWVYADRRRVEQVLLNLLSNAHKFSPGGAGVRLAVGTRGRSVAWTVADDGPGIAPADQQRLFERFFTIGDRAEHAAGSGLGLPISLAIARAHGGGIDVESAPGRGSRFRLHIPARGAPDAEHG